MCVLCACGECILCVHMWCVVLCARGECMLCVCI